MHKKAGTSELGEENVFEELFELIEKHSLDYANNFQLGDFYDIVNAFDNSFQKFNQDPKTLHADLYNDILTSTVRAFIAVFREEGFSDKPIFYAFKRYIAYFDTVLKISNQVANLNDLRANFFENFHSLEHFQNTGHAFFSPLSGYLIERFPVEIGVVNRRIREEEKLNHKRLRVFSNDRTINTIVWNDAQTKYEIIDTAYYADVSVFIDTEKKGSIQKLLTPLWLITGALEQIDNVQLDMREIRTGSLEVKIRVHMKDLVAKEEVNAVLETAKEKLLEGVKQNEGLPMDDEMQEDSFEIAAAKPHIPLIENLNPSTLQKLEIEKRTLENERLKVENAKAKVELIQALSGLVEKGILEADSIRVDINDILYILKENGEITDLGPDASTINN